MMLSTAGTVDERGIAIWRKQLERHHQAEVYQLPFGHDWPDRPWMLCVPFLPSWNKPKDDADLPRVVVRLRKLLQRPKVKPVENTE